MSNSDKRLLGREGERIACEFLRKKRYKILAVSYSSRFGEIYIIAEKSDIFVFVEVKMRKNAEFAQAFEAVDAHKREKIKKTALMWLSEHGEVPCRFDVIEIYSETERIIHTENAFQ